MENAAWVGIDSLQAWRAWLDAHHEQANGVWVVTWKKHCGNKHVAYDDVVAEALCFGWVDSHQRKVDDDRTRLYVSPRRAGSPWSGTNKKRVAKLIREKRMHRAGLALIDQAKRDGSWTVYDDIEKEIEPPDLQQALDANPAARKHWQAFPRQARKNILWWIKSAKREETRRRRITRAVAEAAANRIANHPGQ